MCSLCLCLSRLGLWLLVNLVVVRVDLEEMVQDDEHHGSTSEEDCERVELVVGNHLQSDGASSVAGYVVGERWSALRSN